MDLQALIDKGEELRSEPYDSPLVGMWENDLRATVASYGKATSEVLDSALSFGSLITSDYSGHAMHNEAITKVQKLLEELKKRNSDDTRRQSELINQKGEEAKATLRAKFGNTTINGPVTFGDNSPANNIQVGEIVLGIIKQAEETMPDGPEKEKILQGLRGILANPTFAAIAGAALPEILKRVIS